MRFLARAKGSIEASFSEMGKTVRFGGEIISVLVLNFLRCLLDIQEEMVKQLNKNLEFRGEV